MRIAHIPFSYFPGAVGGTEIYVQTLIRELQKVGTSSFVLAPSVNNESYVHNEIFVRRYQSSEQGTDIRYIYGQDDPIAVDNFTEALRTERPDIVHFHAISPAISAGMVTIAKSLGALTVFTYHTPTISCIRGTLLLWGEQICGGKMDSSTCSTCYFMNLGLSQFQSKLLTQISRSFGSRAVAAVGLRGSLWTAIRMYHLVHLKHMATSRLFGEIDLVIALCEWSRNLLLINGVSDNKLKLIRHGVDFPTLATETAPYPEERLTMRAAFFGRIDPTKGLHVILSALQNNKDLPISLDVYGILQDERSYADEIRRGVEADGRIRLMKPVSHERIISVMKAYDVVLVPSQWLETGPLVVLEALAAGVPVIGSDLGGVAEIISHENNGLLVLHDSIAEWTQALERVLREPGLLAKLRNGISAPRSISEMAMDMLMTYRSLPTLN